MRLAQHDGGKPEQSSLLGERTAVREHAMGVPLQAAIVNETERLEKTDVLAARRFPRLLEPLSRTRMSRNDYRQPQLRRDAFQGVKQRQQPPPVLALLLAMRRDHD